MRWVLRGVAVGGKGGGGARGWGANREGRWCGLPLRAGVYV